MAWMLNAAWLLSAATQAGTIRVPEDYPSVLAAVDAAVAGDSVLVGPGTWSDRETRVVRVCSNVYPNTSVAFLKPGITLIGVGGPDGTVLDGGPAPVVTLLHVLEGDQPVHIEGFTITGGGAAVMTGCTSSDLRLRRCRLAANGARALAFDECHVRVEDCEVLDTGSIDVTLSAVSTVTGGSAEFIRTRFERNALGAVYALNADRILIEDCEFYDHPVRAVWVEQCPDVVVRGSRFERNVEPSPYTSGGASLALGNCQSEVEFCTFAYDSALASHTGGLQIGGGSAQVRNNTFFRCWAPPYGLGAAVYVFGMVATFERNIVAECQGLSAVANTDGTVTSSCNVYWGNTQDFYDWTPAPTDRFVDPEFCDVETGDYRLRITSPCAPENSLGCGLIGAHEVGCGTVGIDATSWGRIKGAYRGEGGRAP